MPRMVPFYSQERHVLMLVAEHADDGSLGGIVCSDLRGSVVFLFGLRIASSLRGQGLAKLLLAAIHERSLAAFPDARAIVTATVPENPAAVSLFKRMLCPSPTHTVESWPGREAMAACERSFGWPEAQPGPDNSILGAVEGARELLASDAVAQSQVARWRPARSLEELHAAVCGIRTGGQPERRQLSVLDMWLPAVFEVLPLDSEAIALALSEGRLWLLEDTATATATATAAPTEQGHEQCGNTTASAGKTDLSQAASQEPAGKSASQEPAGQAASQEPAGGMRSHGPLSHVGTVDRQLGHQRYLGVLVAQRSRELRRCAAGILAATPEAVHSALLVTATRVLADGPHFQAYVERGPGCEAPGLYQASQPGMSFVVFGRQVA